MVVSDPKSPWVYLRDPDTGTLHSVLDMARRPANERSMLSPEQQRLLNNVGKLYDAHLTKFTLEEFFQQLGDINLANRPASAG